MSKPLKLASKHLVEKVGGLARAAEFSRLGRARIQQCYDPNQSDAYLPVDVVAALEEQTEFPYVTKCLADFRFFALRPVEPGHPGGALDLDVLKLTRRFSELMETYHEGLANEGFINPREAEDILQATRELQNALVQLKHQLYRLVDHRA